MWLRPLRRLCNHTGNCLRIWVDHKSARTTLMYRICRNHFPSCNLIQVSHNFLGNWGRAGNLVIPNLSNSVIWTSKACGLLLIDTWINHCIATLFWSRWVVWVWLAPISLLLMCLSRGFLVLERPLTFHRQVLPDIIWELFIKYLPPILKFLGQKLLVAKHLFKECRRWSFWRTLQKTLSVESTSVLWDSSTSSLRFSTDCNDINSKEYSENLTKQWKNSDIN